MSFFRSARCCVYVFMSDGSVMEARRRGEKCGEVSLRVRLGARAFIYLPVCCPGGAPRP